MKCETTLLFVMAASSALAEGTSAPMTIEPIDDGVYLHTSFMHVEGYGLVGSNGLIVIDGDQAFIVDTPWSESDTEALLSWIDEQGFEARAAISTHSHEDRTAGIGVLNAKSIPTYTSRLTNDILLEQGRTPATNVFDADELTLKEGTLEAFYPGAGHTVDNLVVWLPEQRILFGGCLVRSLEWDGLGYVGEASIASWADSIRKIGSRYPNIDAVVPGHGKVGTSQVLDHTIELAEAASATVDGAGR